MCALEITSISETITSISETKAANVELARFGWYE